MGSSDTSPEKLPLLAQIMAMTSRMHDSAQAGEWEALAELEAERRSLLEVLFRGGPDTAHTDEVRQAIASILETDKKTMAMAGEAREKVRAELLQFGKASKAHKAYSSEA